LSDSKEQYAQLCKLHPLLIVNLHLKIKGEI